MSIFGMKTKEWQDRLSSVQCFLGLEERSVENTVVLLIHAIEKMEQLLEKIEALDEDMGRVHDELDSVRDKVSDIEFKIEGIESNIV